MADFGTVDFRSCAFNGQPISDFDWNQIDMVQKSGSTLATASALGSDGARFSVSNYPVPSDVTPPTTTVSGNDDLWHNQAVTLTFTATDNTGGSGVDYTKYKVGSGPWQAGTTVVIPAPANHSNDGTHKVYYYSVDNAGNTEATKSCTVKIDTTPPQTTVSGNDTKWHKTAVTLTFSATDIRSGVDYTEYRVGSDAWTRGTSVTISAPAGGGNDGTHTVSYRSVDKAGNVEATKSCRVKIDTVGPICKAKSVTVKRYHTCTLLFYVGDKLSPKVTTDILIKTQSGVTKKTLSWGYADANYWWTYKFTCTLNMGTYRYYVYGTDLAGNPQSVVGSATLTVT